MPVLARYTTAIAFVYDLMAHFVCGSGMLEEVVLCACILDFDEGLFAVLERA